MDVLNESYKALEKNSNEVCKLTWAKSWFACSIERKGIGTEQERLNKSSKRLQEMESWLLQKKAMKKLKETLNLE
jgi:chemotaxis protein MotB